MVDSIFVVVDDVVQGVVVVYHSWWSSPAKAEAPSASRTRVLLSILIYTELETDYAQSTHSTGSGTAQTNTHTTDANDRRNRRTVASEFFRGPREEKQATRNLQSERGEMVRVEGK